MSVQFDRSSKETPSNTLAAIFATQKDAREALKDLHKAGFKTTWLGITRTPDGDTGEPTVEDPSGLARFISAGGDRQSLHKALIAHGIGESQAQRIEREIAPGCAIVTVYGEDNPEKVAELLDAHKGHVVGVDGTMPTAVEIASMSPTTGVEKDDRKMAERERDVKNPKADDLGRSERERGRGDDFDDDAYGDTFVEHRYSNRL